MIINSIPFSDRTQRKIWNLIAFMAVGIIGIFFFAAEVKTDSVTPIDEVTTGVSIRESASTNSEKRGLLRPGRTLELIGMVPYWYEVRLNNGQLGFVSKRWTKIINPTESTSFEIHIVDVGTGLAVFVSGQDFTFIYDGGSNDDLARGDENRFISYLNVVAPELDIIDHIVLSHPHRDHVELLPDIIGKFIIRNVWDSGTLNPICGYRKFLEGITNKDEIIYHSANIDFGTRTISFDPKRCYGQNLPARELEVVHGSRITNDPINIGLDARMTFLHVDGGRHSSFNENSLVMRLDLGSVSILFTGDAEAGGRQSPVNPPSLNSIEGVLLAKFFPECACKPLTLPGFRQQSSCPAKLIPFHEFFGQFKQRVRAGILPPQDFLRFLD